MAQNSLGEGFWERLAARGVGRRMVQVAQLVLACCSTALIAYWTQNYPEEVLNVIGYVGPLALLGCFAGMYEDGKAKRGEKQKSLREQSENKQLRGSTEGRVGFVPQQAAYAQNEYASTMYAPGNGASTQAGHWDSE
ncbi:hypothetical protein [Streptomyces sp. GQFP]|uniref:hypothetical protein n=1 Tax=Streptomyces sp. GQFP TaxID=2907545 RepID=UPI001F1C091E|nr:hypothetical protein [Streptomyces sp. GQFP]UIX33127.1 hypothetical protein LUX31_25655 [Streptomyces sp. GQFP]